MADTTSTTARPPKLSHPTRADRAAAGKAARARVPLDAHSALDAGTGRPDPVELLRSQGATRVPELVPIRYGRMATTPFAFYRGAALVMASDLARTPTTGLRTQLCGDAHLSNFGVFGSPERNLLFDINDFDETAPGSFEWDVKRLAASLEIAARGNDFKRKQTRALVLAAVASYRTAMRHFATMGSLDVWYARLDVDRTFQAVRGKLSLEGARRTEAALAKARTRDSMQALDKLTTQVDGKPRIVGDPPLVETIDELAPDRDRDEVMHEMRVLIRSYRASLPSDRKHLIEQYQLVDMARKVVGVGSVGTRCWILLLQGIDEGDPLFLQGKEATASVIETVTGTTTRGQSGQRVVHGQRLMQAASDIFLGYQRVLTDGAERDFYVRQLRDWKMSLPIETMLPEGMTVYGQMCGWTLARAHARAGDRVAIASYLGRKDTFDQAVADFAVAYADLNERDHAALLAAIDDGSVTAVSGL
ncbi:MAG: DUF2252 domain-containing protein [Frankiales bacterium]|nr:DUF2252 domain-containing protein [Frankiales bacterium]